MIFIIEGLLGSGKTLLSTWFGLTSNIISPNIEIFSNYKLFNIPYYYIYHTEQLNSIPNISDNQKLLLLDEQWLNADSRRAMSLVNIFQSKKVLQSRKYKADIIITSQDFDQLDKRICRVGNFVIRPTNVYKNDNNIPVAMKVKVIDLSTYKMIDKMIPVLSAPFCYDTFEIVEEFEQTDFVQLAIDKYTKNIYDDANKEWLKTEMMKEDELSLSEANYASAYIVSHR